MERFFLRFVSDDKGAVTVDWVVLCAGVVALAVAAIAELNDETGNVASSTGTYISNVEPGNV